MFARTPLSILLLVALSPATAAEHPTSQIDTAQFDALMRVVAQGQLPPGTYQQDAKSGEIRLVKPERYLVQLDAPALYPALAQTLRQKPEYKLSTRLLNANDFATLGHQQVQAVEQRIAEQQQIARVQLESRFPAASVSGQFSSLTNALIVNIDSQDAEHIANEMAKLPGVQGVYPEQLVHAMLKDSVPKIDAPKVWAMQKDGFPIQGRGIRVAVLDTGVDYTHEALGGCFGAGCKVAGGYDFVAKDADPMDVHGHGTHVASIIAGKSATITGVAPDASIYAYKVLSDQGSGSTFDIVAGLEKAVDPDGNPQTADGAHIINMSLGNSQRDPNDPLVVATNNAAKAGVLVVVAAGNSGPEPETLGSPGIAAEALTVGNTQKDDSLSYDSSRGPGVAGALFKPEMSAPGTSIYAAIPGNKYEEKSGTSMAAPHVAGAAALLLQAEPTLTSTELKRRLVQNTDPLTETLWEHGTGRLNVYKALKSELSFDQSAIYLGRVNTADLPNQGSRNFTLRNTSTQSQTYSLTSSNQPDFVSMELSQSSLTLAAGESKTLSFNYLINDGKIPTTPPSSGSYQLNIVVKTTTNSYQLPVVLDHYYLLKVNFATPINEVDVTSPTWGYMFKRYNLFNKSSIDLKITRPQINLVAEVQSVPDSLIPPETKGQPVVRKSWLVRTGIDVATTPEITLSNQEIKHRLRASGNKKNGEPFWAGEYKERWGNVGLRDGERFINVYSNWTICYRDCFIAAPTEFYASDLPVTADLKVQEQVLQRESSPQQLKILNYRFKTPLQTEDLQANYQEQDMVRLRKTASGTLGFNFNSLITNELKDQVDMHIWLKTIGLRDDEMPDTRIRFVNEANWDGFSTLTWRLTEQGVLQKYRCKPEQCDLNKLSDHELIYSDSERELSFDNNLRYLAAPLKVEGNELKIYPGLSSSDFSYENKIVSDLWLNDAAMYSTVTTAQYCADQKSELAPLSRKYAGTSSTNHFVTALAKPLSCASNALGISYPLDGRDERGLLGEARFTIKTAGFASPYFDALGSFNRGKRGDTISRLDNQFKFKVLSADDPVSTIKLYLKAGTDPWRLAYHGFGNGSHQLVLPQRAGEQWLDVKLEATTKAGNVLVNTMPEALRLGAAAGGDNDVDGDGILNAQDLDNDNDQVPDSQDPMPYDATETKDSDDDGLGNNKDPDDDNDGVLDSDDAFPLDPTEWLDTDKDGIGNNKDPDDDNDGVLDGDDAFPLDPTEWLDTDKDGIGNNADPDDDNDGVLDVNDKYPLDPTRSSDPVPEKPVSSGGGGGGSAGFTLLLLWPLALWRRKQH